VFDEGRRFAHRGVGTDVTERKPPKASCARRTRSWRVQRRAAQFAYVASHDLQNRWA